MPRVTDRAAIRAILETDRPWSVYAIADLAPRFFEQATWFCSVGEAPALALVYAGFATPVLITLGPVTRLRLLLHEIEETLDLSEMYVVVRPEVVSLLTERYVLSHEKAMQRMVLDAARQPPTTASDVARLGLADLEAVQRLYADGAARGEAPDWFLPEMLTDGVYYGARDAGELLAVAGTHVVAPDEGVGCLGNIYTRRDRRGRGLGTHVTGAVTTELREMKLRTIALNVAESNGSAIRAYERLGFHRYCGYVEAVARRRHASTGV